MATDITTDRLRELAETRSEDAKVLSLFVNLDPREFATPPARQTELRSVLDRAGRLLRERDDLTHEQKTALKQDLQRAEQELGNGAGTKGAHGLAVFASSPANLFEILRLPEPVDHEPVISNSPCLAPLSTLAAPEQWCAVLVNRRTARLFCGPADGLDEVALVKD